MLNIWERLYRSTSKNRFLGNTWLRFSLEICLSSMKGKRSAGHFGFHMPAVNSDSRISCLNFQRMWSDTASSSDAPLILFFYNSSVKLQLNVMRYILEEKFICKYKCVYIFFLFEIPLSVILPTFLTCKMDITSFGRWQELF